MARRPHPLHLLAAAALWSGCLCAPGEAVPVTLRLKNTSPGVIYVDDTQGRLGLTVQRQVQGQWFSFDDLTCACRVCGECTEDDCLCEGADAGFIRRLQPGESFERSWDGVVRTAGTSARCQRCVNLENAPVEETFQVSLCYLTRFRSAPDAGRFPGTFTPAEQACTARPFRIADGVVEVGPPRGSACATQADCRGQGELCLDGACTTDCPSRAGEPLPPENPITISYTDNGFFETDGGVLRGSGTLSNVSFRGPVLELQVRGTRPGGEMPVASVLVGLAPGLDPVLAVGTRVTVAVVERNRARQDRGLVLRDADGGLLLAVDRALGQRTLDAEALRPFTVSDLEGPLGCVLDATCGKKIFQSLRVQGPGGAALTLEPGRAGTLMTPQGSFRALNVTSFDAPDGGCTVSSQRPFAVWKLER